MNLVPSVFAERQSSFKVPRTRLLFDGKPMPLQISVLWHWGSRPGVLACDWRLWWSRSTAGRVIPIHETVGRCSRAIVFSSTTPSLSDQSMSLLKPILLQQAVPEQTCRNYAQKGLVFFRRLIVVARSVACQPYPCFTCCWCCDNQNVLITCLDAKTGCQNLDTSCFATVFLQLIELYLPSSLRLVHGQGISVRST